MIRVLASGVVFAAAFSAVAAAAPAHPVSPAAPVLGWAITPTEQSCRADLEMVGRSGAVVPVSLVSDGERLSLRVAKEDVPERAFLPIRIDRKPYANLMLRMADPKLGELVLSEETQAALRKGGTLQIAWLADEPLSVSLAGSDTAIPDLRTCGAQAAAQHRARVAAEQAAQARAQAAAQAQAIAQAQLEGARAEAAAAEAQRQRAADEAERQRLLIEQQRQAEEQAEADRRWAAQQSAQDAYRRPAVEMDPYEDYRPPAWAGPRGYYRPY